MTRVVITGAGVICPLGRDPQQVFDALSGGRSGIRRIAAPWAKDLQTPWAGIVQDDVAAEFSKIALTGLDRASMFALIAARSAVRDAALDLRTLDGERAGVYWGTGMGGAATLESAYEDLLVAGAARLKPSTIVKTMNNAAAGQIGIEFGVLGPTYTFNLACSSSAVAIGEAARAIRAGVVDRAIAGGSEALLTRGVIKAWESLGTIARADGERPETSCRPFARDRAGFLLGEGAAAVVLEREDMAAARGATPWAVVAGYGNTSDASHITQPDAGGQARAMRMALTDAGMAPSAIAHINSHGTGTKVGDVVETRAIRAVFEAHADAIAVSATKALHGHLMGATGALEFLAALMALRRRVAPPTAHLWQRDPECDLDYVALAARDLPDARAVMSNSFGFGGVNAVLIAAAA
ncbi:MAG: beta-ketoacyl-[acyl-carrier-protein] synthase family protein [Burkholderiales bacterium]|nr:beta-ketoacyl-[acyl-carrier-protein] synthase family protein [Burkholderiales bacterium]